MGGGALRRPCRGARRPWAGHSAGSHVASLCLAAGPTAPHQSTARREGHPCGLPCPRSECGALPAGPGRRHGTNGH
eukprot:1994476-Alexandrium_andersonii.AAC.1